MFGFVIICLIVVSVALGAALATIYGLIVRGRNLTSQIFSMSDIISWNDKIKMQDDNEIKTLTEERDNALFSLETVLRDMLPKGIDAVTEHANQDAVESEVVLQDQKE